MNYRHYLILIASLAAVSGCDQMQSNNRTDSGNTATSSAPVLEGVVVATVNNSPLTQEVLDIYATQRKAQGGDEQSNSQEAVLNELISLELMRQDSINKGLDKEPFVIAAIDQQTRTALAGAAIKDFMAKNPVSDEAAKALYDEQIGVSGKEYSARHILVEDEETAKEIIKLLDSGSDFSELAKEKSTGPSGPNGGKLGWFGADQMVKPFADATAALEKGSYTKTPVQTQFGWHVIILDDVRDSTPPPFEDVKDRIKMLLANQQLQQYVESMKSKAVIDIKQ
ncbi:MAG: peptidylprolyl isomerase [Gammaproteobacteria bacterium]|jgi:peptidyl-prolyl cis-trans isomerase C|nr:peptidylprolyl isomerase [Gammaproteobacteria bacterium]